VEDLTQRRLLTPGKRERLDLTSIRLAGHLARAGSRMVVVLSGIRNPGQQINYGSGKEVNDETIKDAGEPLTIRWSNRSWLELPVRRSRGQAYRRTGGHGFRPQDGKHPTSLRYSHVRTQIAPPDLPGPEAASW
jgi:hypothetical protein